ncbi:MAG TPA: hypothetical protein PK668_06195 [Myxococcota bacterium]|nr:hypothetical protein [Myxococcota bacterium]HRY92568.1 hypothetical protein [Myxococcota bacterium]HSA22908.1 hypothetical protein [Myxococcota bacterium]
MKNLGVWLAALSALSLLACSASEGPACVSPQGCSGDPGAGCEWACIDGECRPLCQPECTLAAACEGHDWPLNCVGHWECQAGVCQAVCDTPVCSADGDCTGALPCEFGGAWRCDGGECVADCLPPPDCNQPADCLGGAWPQGCAGHWSCEQSICQAVCDASTCPDGTCDDAGGEDQGSCPIDCVQVPCTTFADCLQLAWPLQCVGVWACQAGTCTARCDSSCSTEGLAVASADGCCAGLHPVIDCPPDLVCEDNPLYCVDCSDRVCDPHENTFNCLADCPQGCDLGARRPFTCPGGATVPWCECLAPACPPVCQPDPTGQEAWRDSCTDQVLLVGRCEGCTAVCDGIGFREEGWYASCPNGPAPELVAYAFCAPRWSCAPDPASLCGK